MGAGANQRQCFYTQADSGLVTNNLVYGDPNGFGIQIRADNDTVKPCNIIVANNTVVDIAGQRGIYVENNCSGVRIRNNIIAFSGGEELYGLYETGIDPPLSSNRAFTNLVWDTSGPLTGKHLRAPHARPLGRLRRLERPRQQDERRPALRLPSPIVTITWGSVAPPSGSPTLSVRLCGKRAAPDARPRRARAAVEITQTRRLRVEVFQHLRRFFQIRPWAQRVLRSPANFSPPKN